MKPSAQLQQPKKSTEAKSASKQVLSAPRSGGNISDQLRKCFLCHELEHIGRDCSKRASDRGRGEPRRNPSDSKQVTTTSTTSSSHGEKKRFESLQEVLYSSDDSGDEDVRVVRLTEQTTVRKAPDVTCPCLWYY